MGAFLEDDLEEWLPSGGGFCMSSVMTVSIQGLDTELVRVETDLSRGLPGLFLVGLPNLTVRESKERIRSAIVNSGYRFPNQRITVNLSPADTRKEGSHFDLPMAVGVLAAAREIPANLLDDAAFFGELSLDGRVCRAEMGLALILGLREKGVRKVFLPEGNMGEAKEVDGMEFFPLERLSQAVAHMNGDEALLPVATFGARPSGAGADDGPCDPDFGEVKGQEAAKRAFQICASGRHDMALSGPPGVGKSMLAERMPGILPPLTRDEMLEVTRIYNIAGCSPWEGRLASRRPFRAPHHSTPPAALLGGGARPMPGELSLAHLGVLFLDELPEFERRTLDMLRQPLEDGYIDISRAARRSRYPCDFIMVTASNPCPCGYYGDPYHTCTCSSVQRRRYRDRVSGPLLDRIDIHVALGRVDYEEFREGGACLTSAQLREGVLAASEVQAHRYRDEAIRANSQLDAALAEKYCPLDRECGALMQSAYQAFSLSARQGAKMVKLARTIADLEGSESIRPEHLAEAISYRKAEEKGK